MMQKTFTKLLVLLTCFAFSSTLTAQINVDSPIPVDFVVNSPASVAGKYDYGTQTGEWGPTLDHTVTGDVVWARTAAGDSLACGPVVNDLTGKMALIRRGTCAFSLKTYHAEQAGAVGVIICNHYTTATDDANTIYNMSPSDSASAVTIPAIFLPRSTCETLTAIIDGGGTLNVSFEVRAFGNGVSAYSYHTPKSEILPLTDMSVRFINLETDTLPLLTLTAEITDPNGVKTTIAEDIADIPGQSVLTWIFDTPYLPEDVGEYNVLFSNSFNSETLTSQFVITDFLYAQDNDDVLVNTNEGWIAPSSAQFATANFRYDFGNFYRTGDTQQTATHMSFMLANPDSLFTGDPSADVFNILLYDADPDGNGTVPGDAVDYDALNEAGGGAVFAGFTAYTLTGTEEPYDLITVEFEDPVVLEPNKIYLLMVQYDGVAAALGTPPWYAYGGTNPVAGNLGEAVFTDRFYTGGWSGDWKGVIRMHMDGWLVGTEEPLDQSKIALSPNPATDVVRLDLELDKTAAEVTVRILDINGKLVRTEQLENVHKGTYSFDVKSLSTGTYFMTVVTPEGFRTKKFQVIR
jgi:hypothetical protein